MKCILAPERLEKAKKSALSYGRSGLHKPTIKHSSKPIPLPTCLRLANAAAKSAGGLL